MPDTCEQEGLPKTTFVVTSSTDTIKTKKRSALATYQDTEPPKKKKKHHFEDVEYIYPSKEPKKEKKLNINRSNTVKNRIDITMDPEQEVVKDKKIKKKVPSNSNDSTSDILQERQHSQNKSNFMNINKLLPVLQSHIECYNKKVFNRTNEMGAASVSSETSLTSSSAIQNNLQLELYKDIKKPYKCKGTLSSYKKKLSVPTITNKYLQEKKVNIVKIEYLSGKHLNMRETESMKSSDTVERENNGDSAYVNNPKIAYININQNLMNKHILSSNNNDLERYMNRNTMKLKNPLKFSIEKEKCFGNSSYENENFRNVDHILLTTNDNIIERGETSRISNKDLNNTITKKEINAVSNETFCYRQLNPIIHNVSLSRNLETKLDNYDSEGSKRLSNTTENINTFEKCILFDKKRNICESISYDVEANSAERVSEAMDSVKKKYETDISQPLLNQCLENNVSGGITSYPVNETLENLSEELQRNDILAEGYIEKMKIHNLSTETDTFKENFSLVCKNNSTNNVSVNEETRTLSDSSKNSEIVLVEDARTLDKPLDTNHRNTSTFSSKKYLSGIGKLYLTESTFSATCH